jgi:hypothetical protein
MSRPLTATVFLVLAVGYFGFEISNLHRLGYRMEPAFILDEFAGAHYATLLCGEPAEEESRRFAANFAHVQRRAIADRQELVTGPDGTDPSPGEWLEQQLAERREEVDVLFDTQGCAGPDMKRLLRLHEIRARLNLG